MKRIVDDAKKIIYQGRFEYHENILEVFNGCRGMIILIVLSLDIRFYIPIIFSLLFNNPQKIMSTLHTNLYTFIPFSSITIFLLIIVIRRIRKHRLKPNVQRFQNTYEVDKENLKLTIMSEKFFNEISYNSELKEYNLRDLKKMQVDTYYEWILTLEFEQETTGLEMDSHNELERLRADIRTLLRKDV